jgi:hypothetical protein
MAVLLDDIQLEAVQNISTEEKRSLIEHKVPGMDGSLFQDMGEAPTSISFEGIMRGEEALSDLEKLRGIFKAGQPVPFTADIATATNVSQVLIENLQVSEEAGRPNYFRYHIALREKAGDESEAEAEQSLQQIAAEIELEADEFLEGIELGLELSEMLSQFIPSLEETLAQIEQGITIFFEEG